MIVLGWSPGVWWFPYHLAWEITSRRRDGNLEGVPDFPPYNARASRYDSRDEGWRRGGAPAPLGAAPSRPPTPTTGFESRHLSVLLFFSLIFSSLSYPKNSSPKSQHLVITGAYSLFSTLFFTQYFRFFQIKIILHVVTNYLSNFWNFTKNAHSK